MKTWRTLGSVGLFVSVLGVACNSGIIGGEDPNCTDPNGCNQTQGAEFVNLIVDPAQATLTSDNGSKPNQSFIIKGQRPDGSISDPLAAVYSVPSNGIGTIDSSTGVFTATGEVGGTVTITATVVSNGVTLTTTMQVTVVLVKTYTTPGTPADAATKFIGTPTMDVAKSAQIVYPLNNVVMPQNVYPADIQWTNGVAGDLYRVQIVKPNYTMTTYVVHSGAAFKYDLLPDAKAWSGAAQTSPDSDAVLTVDRWDKASGTVYSGKPVAMKFAKGSLLGSIYYWDIASGRIRRIDDGTANSVDFMPKPTVSPVTNEQCVGCHVVSRDGRYMVGRLGGGDNVAAMYDLTKDLSTNPPPTEYPVTASLTRFWFASWKPDNGRLITSRWDGAKNVMYLIDPKTGANIPPIAGTFPINGVQPAWSPDGKTIAYVSEANSWGGDGLTTSNLSIMPVTGADSFGALVQIHKSTAVAGSTVDTYPTWSPDSKWIAFQNGQNGRSDANVPGTFLMTSPDGKQIIKLGNATTAGDTTKTADTVYLPNFSPFDVGGHFWLTYVANRPYGNNQAGTKASPHQQLWVSAVKNNPAPGEDPSCVPYWLPGQTLSSKNITAYWAPKACRLDQDTCSTGSECCSGVCTGGKCVPPPNRCLKEGEQCGGGGCCGQLICDKVLKACVGGVG